MVVGGIGHLNLLALKPAGYVGPVVCAGANFRVPEIDIPPQFPFNLSSSALFRLYNVGELVTTHWSPVQTKSDLSNGMTD